MPCASVTPSTPPPLVGLELHGTGAIGILADAESTGYCLLGVEGGGFVYGGLAYGSSEPAPAGSLILGGMSTDFQGMEIGVVWGSAPEGVTTVRIDGGPGDGGIATVEDGHFAIWIPGSLAEGPMEAVALDALLRGEPFPDICETLVPYSGEAEAAARAAQRLRGWVEAGMIATFRS